MRRRSRLEAGSHQRKRLEEACGNYVFGGPAALCFPSLFRANNLAKGCLNAIANARDPGTDNSISVPAPAVLCSLSAAPICLARSRIPGMP